MLELIGKLAIGTGFMAFMAISLVAKFDSQSINLLGGKIEKHELRNLDASHLYRKRRRIVYDLILLCAFILAAPGVLLLTLESFYAYPTLGLAIVFFTAGLVGKISIYLRTDAEIEQLAHGQRDQSDAQR